MAAQLTTGSHAINASNSILAENKDGLDNKDRWHWKERDLREWINQWMMSAFVQFDNGQLFEDSDMTARVITIRGDYEDQQGEAFLNWRKGKCFATYNFGMRLEFQGTLRVDGRIIGQSKGVLRMNDIKYDDVESDDMNRPTSLLQGAWEVPTPGQQHEAGNKGEPTRKPQPYEEAIKDVMKTERGLGPIRTKLAILRKCLQEITESEEVAKGSLPDATINARHAMRALKDSQADATSKKADGLSQEVIQAAEVSAKEYVENLRISGRSERFVKALQEPNMKEFNINLCDIRGGRDIADLVNVIKKNESITALDLRDNFSLDDAALQPLFIALSTGAAPNLKTIRLGGTAIGVMGRNMATGLGLMRKTLNIDLEGSSLS